jgi:hypothetical protein
VVLRAGPIAGDEILSAAAAADGPRG